jgi:hypothetical protein
VEWSCYDPIATMTIVKNIAPEAAIDLRRKIYEGFLSNAVKELLENKHLYQSVTVDMTKADADLVSRMADPRMWGHVLQQSNHLQTGNWIAVERSLEYGQQVQARFYVPDVKLYCGNTKCRRLEAFNLVSVESFLERSHNPVSRQVTVTFGNPVVQLFAISFLCQSCKLIPEAFLIRRVGNKLTLCGRAPMEHVAVPSPIPKEIEKFYSGAVIAHQSGQTLAGIFMFRTLIEQWARSKVQQSYDRADELIDAYMETLPGDFKGRFESMRALYGDLSADMHGAIGSAELFARADSEIVKHFEARKLFGLPMEASPSAPASLA